jgi:hypothetical protein
VNADGVPDLLVANGGSDDVSVLLGSTAAGVWTATPSQRLASGGGGPVAVAVVNAGSPHGPDLLVTNGDGTVALLPGIGSGGKGSGLFQDTDPQKVSLGTAVVESLFDPGTGRLFVLSPGGGVGVLAGGRFTILFDRGVVTVSLADSLLVAGFDNGTIALLSGSGEELTSRSAVFTGQPGALVALHNGPFILNVYVTQPGDTRPVLLALPLAEPVPLPGPPRVRLVLPVGAVNPRHVSRPTATVPTRLVARGTSLPGFDLVLVATLLPGDPGEAPPGASPAADPDDEVFAAFVPPAPVDGGGGGQDRDGGQGAALAAAVVPGDRPEGPSWQSYPLGVSDALRRRLWQRQVNDRVEDALDAVEGVLDRLRELLEPAAASPAPTRGQALRPVLPPAAVEARTDSPAPGPAEVPSPSGDPPGPDAAAGAAGAPRLTAPRRLPPAVARCARAAAGLAAALVGAWLVRSAGPQGRPAPPPPRRAAAEPFFKGFSRSRDVG